MAAGIFLMASPTQCTPSPVAPIVDTWQTAIPDVTDLELTDISEVSVVADVLSDSTADVPVPDADLKDSDGGHKDTDSDGKPDDTGNDVTDLFDLLDIAQDATVDSDGFEDANDVSVDIALFVDDIGCLQPTEVACLSNADCEPLVLCVNQLCHEQDLTSGAAQACCQEAYASGVFNTLGCNPWGPAAPPSFNRLHQGVKHALQMGDPAIG
jgi:hypothetical protein